MDDERSRMRQQQLQELQDISSDYLVQLESIIDSRTEMDDPRDIIMVLKSNLKTARQQIEKISSRSRQSNGDSSPLPNGGRGSNNTRGSSGGGTTSSPSNHNQNANKLQLAPTDSDSTNASSFFSKFGTLNTRIAYDWSNANIEQIYFDQVNMGKIHSISVATSTYDPVIMATISNDGKCRIWKLRQKSKNYDIIHHEKKVHQIQLFETENFQLHTSLSHEVKEADYMANVSEDNNKDKHLNNNNNNNDSKKSSKRGSKKGKKKVSYEKKIKPKQSDGDNFFYSSLGSDANASYSNLKDAIKNDKYIRKELRFELCHEIKLSATWIMCVAIHHEGNYIALGGLDTNVTIYDITTLNENENRRSTDPVHKLSNGFPNTPTIYDNNKAKKEKRM